MMGSFGSGKLTLSFLLRVVICGVLVVVGPAHAQIAPRPQGPELFQARENFVAGDLSLQMGVMRARPVTIDTQRLLARRTGDRLTFNLFENVSVSATIDTLRQSANNTFHWSGSIDGHANSSFRLVYHESALAGLIRVPGVGEFRVKSWRHSGQVVEQINQSGFAPCGTDHNHVVPGNAGADGAPAQGPEDCSALDVMVVYTPEARDLEGGPDAIYALALLAVDETNAAFANSLISVPVRLVHVAETNYVESGDFSIELGRLQDPLDGFMDEVHDLRNQYGADLVDLLISHTQQGQICGIAYLMSPVSPTFESSAFSVCNTGCVLGTYTFQHELGHNLGCHHDRDNASSMPAFDFSYGHRFFGNDSIQHRTIMSYAPGNRIPYFSNPEVLYQGQPTGVPQGTTNKSGEPISADNALTINLTAPTVKDFRSPAPFGPDLGPLSWPSPNALTPIELAAGDRFGVSVAVDGDLAIVGAYRSDDPFQGVDVGAAYIFRFVKGTGWVQEARLVPSDGIANDFFGISVDIVDRGNGSGVAIVGAYQTDQGAKGAGSAYVFRNAGTGWFEEVKLTALEPSIHDSFGYSVSIAALELTELVLIGAYLDDQGGFNSGAAYVFSNENGFWQQLAKLKASDPAAQDNFGISVSLALQPTTNQPYALIGSYRDDSEANFQFDTGSAYVFTTQEQVWTQVDKFKPVTTASGDQFGYSVSLEAGESELVALVGAWAVDGIGPNSGAAYVFRKNLLSQSTFLQEAKLTASDPAANDRLGNAVSLSGDVALVGAYLHDIDEVNEPSTGAAYVYRKRGLGWVQEARIRAADPAINDQFGFSVSVDGARALIGAWQRKIDDTNLLAGAVYVVEAAPVPDCNANGISDACDILIGISDDLNNNGVPDECEKPKPSPCPSDISPAGGDGVVNVNDLLAIINGWGACPLPCPPSCTADISPVGGDCVVNVNDLLAIINAWGACPK